VQEWVLAGNHLTSTTTANVKWLTHFFHVAVDYAVMTSLFQKRKGTNYDWAEAVLVLTSLLIKTDTR